MALRRILVKHFRNIDTEDLLFHRKLNLVYGDNGAGKTSLLEAISYLGLAKTFRTSKVNNLVSEGASSFQLYGELDEENSDSIRKVGIEKSRRGKSQYRVDGASVTRAADLAYALPLQVINTNSFRLLDGGPVERRRFLDWIVFHVKPDFAESWSQGVRCLKQRNALLRKTDVTYKDLEFWDQQLIRFTDRIDNARKNVLELFEDHLGKYLVDCAFIKIDDEHQPRMSVDYFSGWNPDGSESYEELLERNFSKDVALGYTSMGFHKADLKVKLGNRFVSDICSRGQQKLIISAFLIAQLECFVVHTGKECTLLIDDLPAELDSSNISVLLEWVMNIKPVQTFVTGIDLENIISNNQQYFTKTTFKMFHVKHGKITDISL